jgi:hypothetical protein
MRFRITPTAEGLVTVAALLLLLVGCGSTTETPPRPQENTGEALRSKLESAGLDVTWLTASQRSDFFDSNVSRSTLQIDGAEGSLVTLYRFPSTEKAAAGAGRVSRDGMQVPAGGDLAYVSWTGRPHFFRQGPLIAVFCESESMRPTRRDRLILAALQEVMGPQFAGE